MPSLTDLFNPYFLMFLGILVLVVALLVVYFESKMRDQNHKIASMLSLVSTLAEDMNGVKMGLNHLAMTRVGGGMPHYQQPLEQKNNIPFVSKEEPKLIEVSDDDDDDDEDEDESSSEDDEIQNDDDSENNESEYDDSESDGESDKNIKILTLNINNDNNINDIDESENLDLESMGDFEPEDELPEVSEEYVEEILSLKYDKNVENADVLNIDYSEPVQNEETHIPSSSDLKTININLEESQTENLDFKKLSLPKLRSIVSEKGLAGDTSKLKKNELLKLLGIE